MADKGKRMHEQYLLSPGSGKGGIVQQVVIGSETVILVPHPGRLAASMRPSRRTRFFAGRGFARGLRPEGWL
jgi:hypothetical protein